MLVMCSPTLFHIGLLTPLYKIQEEKQRASEDLRECVALRPERLKELDGMFNKLLMAAKALHVPKLPCVQPGEA